MTINRGHPRGRRTNGYKSELENSIAEQLKTNQRVVWDYEPITIFYDMLKLKYTPDFVITRKNPADVMFIEGKGYMDRDERKKFKHIKKSNPGMDIRFVFHNWTTKLSKRSKTTYRQWAEKEGFLCANKQIPSYWIEEFLSR